MSVKPIDSTPATIKKRGNKSLQITWEDTHVSEYTFRHLRQNCPCAACRDELSGAPMLNPDHIPLDLEGTRVETVGGYGLSFGFSDSHATGIYHFEYLRRICPCPDCKGGEEK